MSFLKFKFIIGFLPLMFWACGATQTSPSINAQSGGGNINQQDNKSKSGSAMIIRQGTVGRIEKFSVGVRNADATAAGIAVINPALPQIDRNDFNISFTVKSGDLIPVGNKFYRVVKVTAEEIEIEAEPDKNVKINLQENALNVPDGGVLELHKYAVEVVSIESAGGKDSAKIEIYSNDSPKHELEKKNAVRQLTVSVGDEISVGEKKHTVTAIHSAKGSARGVVEISL